MHAAYNVWFLLVGGLLRKPNKIGYPAFVFADDIGTFIRGKFHDIISKLSLKVYVNII